MTSSEVEPRLLNHQLSALEQLKEGKRSIFFPYGFGKSPVALQIAKLHFTEPGTSIVILCEKRNISTWQDHLTEWWTGQPLTVHTVEGNSARWRKTYRELGSSRGLLSRAFLISYSSLSKHIDTHVSFLKTQSVCVFIADESTNFKNPKTGVTKACLKIASSFSPIPRYILTGDPKPEGPHELWSQLEFTGRNPFQRTYYYFLREWFIKPQFGSPVLKHGKEKHFTRLLEDVGIWIGENDITTIEKDLGIPAHEYAIETYELSTQQQALLYHLYRYWALPGDSAGTPTEEEFNYTMSLHTKAQQICSGFYYTKDGVQVVDGPNRKVDRLVDLVYKLLAEEPARKIVVWRKYSYENEILFDALSDFGVTIGPDRQARDIWNADSTCHILIMPVDVSKGFNDLVAADVDIFFSNDFSQEKRNQAETRLKRPGGKHSLVRHFDLCSNDGRDAEVVTALQGKDLSTAKMRAIINRYADVKGGSE